MATRYSSRSADFLPGMPYRFWPLPALISSICGTGSASTSPSLLTSTARLPGFAMGCAGSTLRVLRNLQHGLALLVARVQLAELGGKAVARIARQQPPVVGLADQHRREGRAVGRIDRARQRLAVAARGRQLMRIQAVGPAGGVDEHRLLQVAALRRRLELVAALVAQGARVDVVALGGAHPAEARQDHGDRFAGQQLGLGDRLRRLALDQLGAPVIAVLLGVAHQLVAHQPGQLRPALEDGLRFRRAPR